MSHCANSTPLPSMKTRLHRAVSLVVRTTLLASGIASSWVSAATFELPPTESRIVGRIQQHEVAAGETLAIFFKQKDIGFLFLMAANKGVDPFLPAEGYVLRLSTRLILP